ncbi:MAG: hypothetical protein OEY19_08500 [Gammaproteobacteria bacterium]|nr:hypothetical protein [Gammaproteobacteria bacterium]MDH5630944.1 hypothetical protein [Gammaproteobacteria bacterium]
MKVLFTTLFILMSSFVSAEQKVVTDKGEEVILYSNGTWEYTNQAIENNTEIKTNNRSFKKTKDSTFLIKSSKNNTGYWIDTNKWEYTKTSENSDVEYQFNLRGRDLFGMTIAEEVEMSLETLADIALTNAKNVAPNARVVKKEYRNVNGVKVLYMELTGTIDGINFKYFGYYHTDESGSTQFLAYTAENIAPKYEKEIQDFLNGFTLQ